MTTQSALDRLCRSPRHSGAVLARGGLTGPVQMASAGNLGPDTPFFAASATKLLVTALMLLHETAGLPLDTPFRAILTGDDSARLQVTDGRDRTGDITLRMLLQHTSGLPDYFESATPKKGLLADLTSGHDRGWSFADAMAIARRLGPVGAPGDLRRAHYSDTNFQILGRVLETVEGAPLAQIMARRLFAPLGLTSTWLYTDPADPRPAPLRFKDRALPIPQAMASFQGDGGLVTTATEGLALVRAFFGGGWFPPARLAALQDWRPAWFPLSYGTGIMRFSLPRIMTLGRRMPPLIGHSGLSGAVLFHCPDTGLCLAGTVNQIDRPGTVFRLMARAAMA
jgi:D-alanyl-D-alanine carboxypeptidase